MPRTDVITAKERQLLKCFYTARGLFSMSAPEVLSAHPVTFEGRSPQGIHQTAASLVRKGLLVRAPTDNLVMRYRITDAGIAVCRG